MLLAKEVVEHLSRQLITRLTPKMMDVTDPAVAVALADLVIIEELSAEDKLNDEVREILSEYSEYMRRENVSYSDMFRRTKQMLVNERKIVRASGRDTGDGMKLSRDKITDISHKLVACFRKAREFRLKKPDNDIRLEIVKSFTELLQAEDRTDKAARQKIKSQKREIIEGSEEFDLLFRRYYAEEMRKIGIDLGRH